VRRSKFSPCGRDILLQIYDHFAEAGVSEYRTRVGVVSELIANERATDLLAPSESISDALRLQARFEESFERFRERYHRLLERCLHHQKAFLIGFFAACVVSVVFLVPWLGQDFFPAVDSGQFKASSSGAHRYAHRRDRTFVRLGEQSIASRYARAGLEHHRNIGLPYSGINLTYSTSAP